jgi:hypothetical protein
MTKEEVDAVWEFMRANNVARIEVSYQGGNDEGGADETVCYDADKKPMRCDIPAELEETLEEPIYDEYGGFGGCFDVSGVCVWNLKKKSVKLKGSQTDWVPFQTPVTLPE